MAIGSNSRTRADGTSLKEHDQFGFITNKAREILRRQTGLIPKVASNTNTDTNVKNLDKTMGDLVQLIDTTTDPVWKENYRVALTRIVTAVDKANNHIEATPMDSAEIERRGLVPVYFNHPLVGVVPGSDVSAWSARQCGYQQRFNPPLAPPPLPILPLDSNVWGSEYNWIENAGDGTTAIDVPTNPSGSYLQASIPHQPWGTSKK